MLSTYERHSRAKLAATVVSILVIASLVVVADHVRGHHHAAASSVVARQANPPVNVTAAPVASSPSATTSPGPSSSYTATSNYYVPNGTESIQVKASVNNGVITDVSIQNSESDPTSAYFQESFAAQYKSYVVGKKISGLQLGTVAGASDTTQAFNDALSQIANKVSG